MGKKRRKLLAKVEKIIKPVTPNEPEKAQIGIDGADHLYREIRIENVLTDETGKRDTLNTGDDVAVIIEREGDARKEPDHS